MDKATITREIKLFDADSLEYSGSIVVTGKDWQYENCTHDDLQSVTTGMPLKAVLANLIIFNLVYDDIYTTDDV